jgi:hypothetical protein
MTSEEKAALSALLEKLRHIAMHSYRDEIAEAVDVISGFLGTNLDEMQRVWNVPIEPIVETDDKPEWIWMHGERPA